MNTQQLLLIVCVCLAAALFIQTMRLRRAWRGFDIEFKYNTEKINGLVDELEKETGIRHDGILRRYR